MNLSEKLKKSILEHAEQCFPLECCGVVVNGKYHACRNIAVNQNQFEIHPEDLVNAADQGEIQAYVHSHPDATAQASELDLIQVELHGKPWVICAFPDVEFQIYKPCDYRAPLIGRNYYHGWQDCYSIVRDFYLRELNITLMDFVREECWWEAASNESLYLENFGKAGFIEVLEPKYGDMIICRVGRTEHPNHAVLWLGDRVALKSETTDPCFGQSIILHHPYGRKSIREIWGEQWEKRKVKVLRHVENN